ncbi:MAG TPA: GntR family transcriptional regulator [Pseudogracilibacillus sp.]|nr:GntR family transcriptional regulator [Pseudogracilibacillus sp.]
MKKQLTEDRPIYIQIKEMMEDAILQGTMKLGERVPSTNELAKFYQINPATARQGMNELVDEGILMKRRGIGMFVTDEAVERIKEKRTEAFVENFIKPLKEEAAKLNMSEAHIIDLLKEEK